jgi:spermidine/putrescine transport system permease protein
VSLLWYAELFGNESALTAVGTSLWIAVASTSASTFIGTCAAIGLVRYTFPGRRLLLGLMSIPLVLPQLVLGIILLAWCSAFDLRMGFVTTILGHVVYITPFVTAMVEVRLLNLDQTLEMAARDCGATTWQVQRFIVIPMLWPGILVAAILAFLLSWGNFYLTYLLGGTLRTLPAFVFSGISMGSSPLYPALATVVFVPGMLLVLLADNLRRRIQRTPSA